MNTLLSILRAALNLLHATLEEVYTCSMYSMAKLSYIHHARNTKWVHLL